MTANPAGTRPQPPRQASATSSAFVTLTGEAAGHLAEAVRYYARGRRGLGMPVPPALLELARQLDRSCATPSHAAPPPADAAAGREARHVFDATPLLVSRPGAARLLGCSERTIDRLVARGDLPAVRLGDSATRYRTADVAAYVDQLTPTRP